MPPIENDKFGVISIAEAMKWVTVVSTFVGVMTLPPLGGIWIDILLGTKGLLAVLGAMVGFVGGIYCLLEMLKATGKSSISKKRGALCGVNTTTPLPLSHSGRPSRSR